MKTIPLTQGLFSLVDDGDYDYLVQWKWTAQKSGRKYYAIRESEGGRKNRRRIYMHRLIMQPKNGLEIDHIDHDGLNNTRKNLRIVTRQQNMQHRLKKYTSMSLYKGISWRKRDKRWQANIRVNNRLLYLGQFVSSKDAAKAYDMAAMKHFGEFAVLNFDVGSK